MSLTSLIRGTLVNRIGSKVNSEALMIARALFLLPFVVMVPERGWPPWIFHWGGGCCIVLQLDDSLNDNEEASQYSVYVSVRNGLSRDPSWSGFPLVHIVGSTACSTVFVDVILRQMRGLAIDWAMHCPDWDGMCFYRPCTMYLGKHACSTSHMWLCVTNISSVHNAP